MSRIHEQLSHAVVPPSGTPPPPPPPIKPPRKKSREPAAGTAYTPELPFDQAPPEPAEPELTSAPAETILRPILEPVELPSPHIGRPRALFAFSIVGVLIAASIAYHVVSEEPPPAAAASIAPHPATPPPEATPPPPQPPPEAAIQPEPEPAAVSLPVEPVATPRTLSIPGARVNRDEDRLSVVFDYGIFARVDQLRPESKQALTDLVDAMKAQGGHVSITVTGFTDDDPVPPNRPYKTNVELGMMRAMAVTRALAQAGFPLGQISTRSLGDQQAPYPNDTPENKARNRTATIDIRMDD